MNLSVELMKANNHAVIDVNINPSQPQDQNSCSC